MICRGCGNPEAWSVTHKKEALTGRIYDECNICFDASVPHNPDVYFKAPYWDEHLHDFDDPSHDLERGTYIRSREHKAYVMKKLGLREAGYKRHGSRNDDVWKYRERKGLV